MERKNIILYKNKLIDNKPICLLFNLTSDVKLSGSYTLFDDGYDETNIVTDEIVEGYGDSQLFQLFRTEYKNITYNSFIDLIQLVNKNILLYTNNPNEEVQYGVITEVSLTQISYVLNINTDSEIKYIDFLDGKTIFSYKRKTNIRTVMPPHFIVYEGIQDDPKILSDVFIERGVYSGFDTFKRLKQVKSINELIKYGNGYFNVTTKATDLII